MTSSDDERPGATIRDELDLKPCPVRKTPRFLLRPVERQVVDVPEALGGVPEVDVAGARREERVREVLRDDPRRVPSVPDEVREAGEEDAGQGQGAKQDAADLHATAEARRSWYSLAVSIAA